MGGNALIEGTVVSVDPGGVINPLTAGGSVTLQAAIDTRHVEDSVFTSSAIWQSTDSKGSITQTLHMPEIHGTVPNGASAYQGAGGLSVQLPAGASVRTTIEALAKEPGKEYLAALANRSDVDWQRVEVLNKSLDFSQSGLTKEAAIIVAVVVAIVSFNPATALGNSVGSSVAAGVGEGVALSGGGTFLTATGTSIAGSVGAAVTAATTSLASTAAVSLINSHGDIGAVLNELGSKENLQGLLLTMATAGLSQGILGSIPVSGGAPGATLASVNAASPWTQVLGKNIVQGLSSAVMESAVLGTSLEDSIKANLQGALINTGAALGANATGDAASGPNGIDATSKAIAHALLGCAIGSATSGSSAGCAPGATGAVVGELVAGWYAENTGYDQLKIDASKPGASEALKQQFAVASNTMAELAKLTGAGGALLVGGDANAMQLAMNTANNAAVNNRQLHTEEAALIKANAQRYADLNGISPSQAEAELTQQALRQVDSKFAGTPNNARAAAFLSDLTRGAANFYQATGQTLFNETGNASLYNNHALNAQFLADPGMRALYNEAQRPGAGPAQFDSAAYALVTAVADKANLDQLSGADRRQVLSAMLQTQAELPTTSSNRGTLIAATDRLAADMQLSGEITFSERVQISKEAFLSLAAAQGAASAAGAIKVLSASRIAVAEKAAIQAAEATVAAKARLESNANTDASFAGGVPVRPRDGKTPAGTAQTDTPIGQHLIQAEIKTIKGQPSAIAGGHNIDNFNQALQTNGGQVIGKPVEVAPGIYQVEYRLPGTVGKNEFKTVYDPAKYTDAQMASMANEAVGRAIYQWNNSGGVGSKEFVVVNGVKFEVPISSYKGQVYVPTAYPAGK